MCTNFSPYQNGLSLTLPQWCEWSAVHKVVLLPDSAPIDNIIYVPLIQDFLLFSQNASSLKVYPFLPW